MQVNKRIVVSISVILLLSALWVSKYRLAHSPRIIRTVSWSFAVSNRGNELISDLVLLFPAPVENASNDNATPLKGNIPLSAHLSPSGNAVAEIHLALTPFGTKTLTFEGTYSLGAPNPESPPGPQYTADSPIFNIHSPQITNLANTIAGDNPLQIARNAFDLSKGRLERGPYDAEDRGAVQALESSSGDCTEFASLLVALLRARGIPARRVAGYIVPSSKKLLAATLHNWVELYADGRWILADPYFDIFDSGYDTYLPFQRESKSELERLTFNERVNFTDTRVEVKLD